MSGRPESERSDWTDLDLLTREEASGRLHEEIAEIEPRLAELGENDNDNGDDNAAERELLESRLRALREALDEMAGS
jgi:hypothetical protein